MMRSIVRALFFVVLACGPMLAWGATAQEQLKAFVATVQSATGSFSQVTTSPQGGKAAPAQQGAFAFQRPGKFRWEVQKPYAQLIVADGKQVYQYDPDLAQVTVRDVGKAIGASPAAILFGSGDLEQAFNVTALPDKDGLQWLRAKPHSTADAGFAQVDIGMRDNLPVRILLLDAFGQTTRVDLSGLQANASVPVSQFQFTAPKGTDVVRM
ncbi:MAG TPA: outer membrane lipoprotein chaperone LolA [Bordetella sp.]|uniref:outer membrane lipoprotein chaperone LolA n=1 Tax=Bordetella sp. TaxID=28081 RepID=UPI002ED3B76B